MRGEIDRRQRLVSASREQVVEALAAGRALQPVDAAEAAIVEHHDDELATEHDRGCDLRVHHQVAAVADHDEDLALGLRHLDAEPAGDLVAHAGKAVFEVVAAGLRRAPQLVQLARQPAGGADHDVGARGRALHRADTCASVGALCSRGRRLGGRRVPLAPSRGSRGALPGRGRAQPPSAADSSSSPASRVADQRHRVCLPASKGCTLRLTIRRAARANSAREPVVKSCSRVPTASTSRPRAASALAALRAGDADRAHVQRMVPGQRALAGLGLRDRDAVALGESRQRRRRARIVHAAAGDDQRPLGAAQAARRRRAARPVGPVRRGARRARRRSFRDSRRPRPARPGRGPA